MNTITARAEIFGLELTTETTVEEIRQHLIKDYPNLTYSVGKGGIYFPGHIDIHLNKVNGTWCFTYKL